MVADNKIISKGKFEEINGKKFKQLYFEMDESDS